MFNNSPAFWEGVLNTPSIAPPIWSGRAFTFGNTSVSGVTIPAGDVGDILVAFIYFSMNSNVAYPSGVSGWNVHFLTSTSITEGLCVFSRIATGSDSISFSGTGTFAWAASVMRFPVTSSYHIIVSPGDDGGTGTAPDPVSLAVSHATNYLWFAIAGVGTNLGTNQNFNSYPSGYSNTASSYTTPLGSQCTIGIAEKVSSSSPEDPGAFAVTTSQIYRTRTAAMYITPASSSAPTFIGTGTTNEGFGDLTFNMPAGIAAGDLLLAQIGKNQESASTVNTGTSGTGWTRLPWSNILYDNHEFYYKIATGTDAFRVTTSQWTIGCVHCVRGASPERMTATTQTYTNTTSPPIPANTPISGNRAYLALAAMFCANTNKDVTAVPSGYGNANTVFLSNNIGTVFSAWKTATSNTFPATSYTYATNGSGKSIHILFWGAY